MPTRKTVVIAPDKFKGSLSATQAVEAISRGVREAVPEASCRPCPMADGGEGTVDVFIERGALRKHATVRGPLGEPVCAAFALDGATAIIEMSSASGLGLLEPSAYDPLRADTFGTGQLIAAALDAGATRLIAGIGGSATTDAGTGMLRALGARYLDEGGRPLGSGIEDYDHLHTIDVSGLDPRLAGMRIEVAVDVDNPLCGKEGAARTFAAQKGATPAQIDRLESILSHVADIAQQTLHRDERAAPGAGAAGGVGFAFIAFLGATLHPGVDLIARECGLDGLLADAAVCMTGEGKIDSQTVHGKTVDGVGALARKCGVPVLAFGGTVERAAADALAARGIEAIAIAPEGMPLETSMRTAATLLQAAAKTAMARFAAEITRRR